MPVSAFSYLNCTGREGGAPHIPSVSFFGRNNSQRVASRRTTYRIITTIWTALPHKPILLQIHRPRTELKDVG